MQYKKAHQTLCSNQGQLFDRVLAQTDAICPVQEQAPPSLAHYRGLGPSDMVKVLTSRVLREALERIPKG